MNIDLLITELEFKAVRSSGPGGQHVNKTSSKVEVYFDIDKSEALTKEEKDRIHKKLSSRISSEGILFFHSSETRSQHKNKALVIEKLIQELQQSLKRSKPRRKTKPSRGSIEKRLKLKKQQGQKKSLRKPPSI